MYLHSNPARAADPHALPNAEVFYVDERTAKLSRERPDLSDELNEPGWYYWPCFPGCLPDGPANGPYASERQAIEACQLDDSDSIE
ncbi:Uncharacterised protein [uncultured archaeon]|nr:Uncharacterised protein [uncultured archaeon]